MESIRRAEYELAECGGNPALLPRDGNPENSSLNFIQTLGKPAFEEPGVRSTADAKRGVDFAFKFEARGQMHLLIKTCCGGTALPEAVQYADQSLGAHALSQAIGGTWRSTGNMHAPPGYKAGALREDLEPAGVLHVTAYAKLGTASLSNLIVLRGNAPGEYASEACAGHVGVMWDGWDCDRARWYDPAHGASAAPAGTFGARPGDVYHLRDVDCLDGSLASGAPSALAALSGESCPAVG